LSAACGCKNETQIETVTNKSAVTEFVTEKVMPKSKLLPSTYYDRNSFSHHISAAVDYGSDNGIFCGTVPHHLLAGRLIAGFLQTAASSRHQTDTVVVTATMHFTEDSPLCTSLCDWETPFGTLECDTALTEAIIKKTGAVCDDDMAALDHGISALIPYIKYYFPDSQIAFLLVDEKADEDIPDRLAELYSSFDKDCLFLFSADFSHYLPAHETEQHDLETISAVDAWDYEKIASMTDDNVDSPYVLETFLRLAESNSANPQLLDRSNSMLISGVPYSEKAYPEGLTSYLVYAAEK
ncbi:MAG: AmmeMemoRadiSam system protein B, partial [Oscillospiraceae bacterium]|nr:AmmeMemoRadiSam system protein B [Oscillospiraceae bacterium]